MNTNTRHFLILPCVSGICTRLTWLGWFGIRLKPISGIDQAVLKFVAQIKVVKNQKLIILVL